jgi:hypothetical protein
VTWCVPCGSARPSYMDGGRSQHRLEAGLDWDSVRSHLRLCLEPCVRVGLCAGVECRLRFLARFCCTDTRHETPHRLTGSFVFSPLFALLYLPRRDAHAMPLEARTCGKYTRDDKKRHVSTPYLFVLLKNGRYNGGTIVRKQRFKDIEKRYVSESARSPSKTMKCYEKLWAECEKVF